MWRIKTEKGRYCKGKKKKGTERGRQNATIEHRKMAAPAAVPVVMVAAAMAATK